MKSYDENNLLLDTDSYKVPMWLQYPPNTTSMYSYLESRGGLYANTIFFGLQYYIKKYLEGQQITQDKIDEAANFYKLHGEPFNKEGFEYILKEHGGKLPILIKAVPEGLLVPTGNILLSCESTDPKCAWIVSYLETMLVRLWYPITVATTSYTCKKIIMEALQKTSDNPEEEIGFKLHDFGSRGVSSRESAGIGGAAHLVNFLGSDTVWGVKTANEIYNSKMSGFSIPAAEHSTITSWGKDREVDAYRNMLKHFAKPGSMVAIVSDSYDIYNACENIWGGLLKQEVIDSGATVILRPDSGCPVKVPLNCLEILESKFGCSYNSKGYKVLNHVRVIQGDGMNIDSIRRLTKAVVDAGYSMTNIAFGMGGGLLQKCDRDTQKFAYKCSWITSDGKSIDVFKVPVTDKGKKSKKGKLGLVKRNGKYETVKEGDAWGDILQPVFKNGEMLIEHNLEDIRKLSLEEL